MKKRILCLLLSVFMIFGSLSVLTACGDVTCTNHVDNDGDGICDTEGCNVEVEDEATDCKHVDKNPKDAKCDKCGADVECKKCVDKDPKDAKCDVCGKAVACTTCVDANKDLKCDVCGGDVACTDCVDANPVDGKCDVCGKTVAHDHADADNNGECDICGIVIANDPCAVTCQKINNDADGRCDNCGKTIKHNHNDKDGNGKCDICSLIMNTDSGDDEYGPVPWEDDDPIELFFMMSHNTDAQQNPSGCQRYLAGEDTTKRENIDDEVSTRNSDAEYYTNVKVSYDYYPDVSEYGWGDCIEIMFGNVSSGAREVPDMYCNFTYDMVGASLKGTFHNLKNTQLDQGNFFQFLDEDYDENVDDRGYMYEYMQSTTLSLHKTYILASDYFLDLIRAFFIVPVNIELLESAGMEVTGDLNEDGKFTIDDFYEEVNQKKWTYNKVMQYSAKVFRNTGSSNAGEDIEDVLGFALAQGGLAPSGILYSTDITIISKEWDPEKGDSGDWVYTYPAESEELYTLFDNIKTLVTSPGVVYVCTSGEYADANVTKYGSDARIAVRTRFCDNKILFGGVIVLGALEYQEYQTLKDASGFGVVPVPLYHEVAFEDEESYLTSIHNNARPGGIAVSTSYFTACTAFLDYQSTHSTHILEEYYDYNLQYQVVDGEVEGTVEMLRYIRNNVRSAFDKTFEDAIGVYNAQESHRWHHILSVNGYQYDIRKDYSTYRPEKQGHLETLYNEYPKLP